MNITARMMLVFLVALINLGLGFAAAVHAGRGPWSRYAKRLAASYASSKAAETPDQSVEQIAEHLAGMERRFEELLKHWSEEEIGSIDPTNLDQLRSTIQEMSGQVQQLAANESPELHEQAATGLRTLALVLHTATTELGKMIEPNKEGSMNPVPLLTSLQMACREVNMVFNALAFAELPN
jgi:hypothetical protein